MYWSPTRTDLVKAVSLAAVIFGFLATSTCSEDNGPKLRIGEKIPDFSVRDQNGQPRSLSDFANRPLIIEWTNNGCDEVQRHYLTNNMQATQKAAQYAGIQWVQVISGTSANAKTFGRDKVDGPARPSHVGDIPILNDIDGTMARAFGASTTPELFAIDKSGTLIYAGGIDNPVDAALGRGPVGAGYVVSVIKVLVAGGSLPPGAPQLRGCPIRY